MGAADSNNDDEYTPPRGAVEFRQIEHAWNQVFLGDEKSPFGQRVRLLEGAACGFTHSMLFMGSRVLCDALLRIANEQAASMNSLYTFTGRDVSMYFAVRPPQDFLYVRRVTVLESDAQKGLVEDRHLYFAILGHRDIVFEVSERLDALIDSDIRRR